MNKEDPDSLPEGDAAYAEDIDTWLKSGAKDQEQPTLTPEEIERRKELSNRLSEGFIIAHFNGMPGSDLRKQAEVIHSKFLPWKSRAIDIISLSQDEEKEVYLDVAHGFNLSHVATYAFERFNEAARQKGRADMGSKQELHFGRQADYWSRVEQITSSAAEMQ